MREVVDSLGIDYRVADVTEPDQWWDGTFFDGAVCEMAMMDIDDLPGTVARRRGHRSAGRVVRDLDGAPLLPRQR